MTLTHTRRGLIAFALAFLGVGGVSAQTWPTGPIKLIVPFPPGGSVDMVARAVGKRLGDAFGQPIICPQTIFGTATRGKLKRQYLIRAVSGDITWTCK